MVKEHNVYKKMFKSKIHIFLKYGYYFIKYYKL